MSITNYNNGKTLTPMERQIAEQLVQINKSAADSVMMSGLANRIYGEIAGIAVEKKYNFIKTQKRRKTTLSPVELDIEAEQEMNLYILMELELLTEAATSMNLMELADYQLK